MNLANVPKWQNIILTNMIFYILYFMCATNS